MRVIFAALTCLALSVHRGQAAATADGRCDGTAIKCAEPCATMKCAFGCVAGSVNDACKECPQGICCAEGTQAFDGKCIPMTCDAANACKEGMQCESVDRQCKTSPCPQFECTQPEEECTGGCAPSDYSYCKCFPHQVFDGKGIAQCEAWGDNDGATGDTVCAVDPISNTCAGCNVLDQKACDTTNCAWSETDNTCQHNKMSSATKREGCDDTSAVTTCKCGETCKSGTFSGTCQADGKTCANNIQAPECGDDENECTKCPETMVSRPCKNICGFCCDKPTDPECLANAIPGADGKCVCPKDLVSSPCRNLQGFCCNKPVPSTTETCTNGEDTVEVGWSGKGAGDNWCNTCTCNGSTDTNTKTCMNGKDTVEIGWKGKGAENNWCNTCECDENGLSCTKMGCVGTDPDLETGCKCGDTCKSGTVSGVCQEDGKTCANNIKSPNCMRRREAQKEAATDGGPVKSCDVTTGPSDGCPQAKCAVPAAGCILVDGALFVMSDGKCCREMCKTECEATGLLVCTKMGCVGTDPDLETSCTCGEPCNLFKGAVCQADGKACAINKRPPLCFTTGGVKPLPTGTTCGIKVKDSIVEVNDACVTDVATLLTKFNKGETVAEIGAKLTLDKSTIAATAKALSDFKAALDRDGAELRLKVKGCNAAADACTDTELAEFEALVSENKETVATADSVAAAIFAASTLFLDGSGSGDDLSDLFGSSATTMAPVVTICVAALAAAFMGAP